MRARAWAWWLAVVASVAGARELDPAACAPRFDVQRDKIIRTEESREMGARYLSELDVGARHECLRLCCETDACDVFVYEEKGPGSCYLFNCGPPEDFRCKFTAHGNFSSGVLALSRHLAELQDQERLAHHEQELANLRSATSSTTAARATTPPAAAPSAPPAPPRTSQTLHLDRDQPLTHGRCSRYQFECRRGGECIAVYNACDGVPQCADGSDEAPELGCPPPPPPPPAPAPEPASAHIFAGTTPQPQPRKPAQDSLEASVRVGASLEALGADGAPPPAPPGERWPHRLTQAQPQHRYSGNDGAAGSHIFSHKGGLLQEPEGNALGVQYPPFEPPWPRRGWPQHRPSGLAGMEGAPGERGWSGSYSRGEWAEPEPEPEPDPRRAWPVPQPPAPEQESPPPVYMGPKTMPEIPVVYLSQQQTLRDAPKKGFELIAPRTAAPPPAPAPPAAARAPPAPPALLGTTTDNKLLKDKVPARSVAEAGAAPVGAARAHTAPDEHDGLSEHPPAAVLLLVLGVVMTAAMGAMLGCRARAARRRLRRGKSPFAHDADYLVNGMYL